MKAIFFLCALLLLLDPTVAAKKTKSAKKSTPPNKGSYESSGSRLSPEVKLQKLEQQIANYGPLVELGDKNFSTFITDRPRDYYSVVFLTATDPQYQCAVCMRTKQNAIEVAKTYFMQYNLTNSSPDKRIVFFNLEAEVSRRTFAELQLDTIPRLYIIPPAGEKDPRSSISDHEKDNRPFIDGLRPALELLQEQTNVNVSQIKQEL